MCALYENYLTEEEVENEYVPTNTPHCLAKRDVNEDGKVILDFDRLIDRDCHAPSYHKLMLIDSQLRDADSIEIAYKIFKAKYIDESKSINTQ